MGSKAPADCARRDTIWHLARVLVKRFLPSIYLFNFEVVTSKEGCGRWVQQQERGVPGAAAAGQRWRHIRYFTGLTRFTGRHAALSRFTGRSTP
jgi:hypothetical protein